MFTRVRVIPVLLLADGGVVKTVKFRDPVYVGDPINAVKIFNDKEVDEIVILDISATTERRAPDFDKIEELAGEAFMPLAYGGGITCLEHVQRIINVGVEKVVINTATHAEPQLMSEVANTFGTQSIVACADVSKDLLGRHRVRVRGGSTNTGMSPEVFAKSVEKAGAGEIIVQAIEREGTYRGYDLPLIRKVVEAVDIPVVALGGAGNIGDFVKAVAEGASAVSAGSMFVFHGPHKAVLITYPDERTIEEISSYA